MVLPRSPIDWGVKPHRDNTCRPQLRPLKRHSRECLWYRTPHKIYYNLLMHPLALLAVALCTCIRETQFRISPRSTTTAFVANAPVDRGAISSCLSYGVDFFGHTR